MSDYTKIQNWASKDAGTLNSDRLITGTGFDNEFNAIVTAISSKANSASPTLTTPNIGTPSAGILTNCTGLPIVAGTTGTLSVARGGTGVTTSTGTGDAVLSTSPTLVTPNLGTPSALVGTNITGTAAGLTAGTATVALTVPLYNYLSKCTMSTAGASTTMTISAGACTDSTNAYLMVLSEINKTTASWSVGTNLGGIDSGSIANSTWYYFYVIRRPDTGIVDVIFSTSSTSPTLPANYTQYRYIGAGKTNASAQWEGFTQAGREFYWSTPTQDYAAAGSTTAQLLTCNIPLGRKMKVFLAMTANSSGLAQSVYFSDPSNADLAPGAMGTGGAPGAQIGVYFGGGAGNMYGSAEIWSNTSAQIRHRELTTVSTYIQTYGWIDLADKE